MRDAKSFSLSSMSGDEEGSTPGMAAEESQHKASMR